MPTPQQTAHAGATATGVRRLYGALTAVFGSIGVGGLCVLPAKLANPDFNPLQGITDGTGGAYLVATVGALGLGLAGICYRVFRKPELSADTGAPLSLALLGMAVTRFAVPFYASDAWLAETRGAMAFEVALFSTLAAGVGMVRTDARWGTLTQQMRRFMGQLGRLKPALKAWLLPLGCVVAAGPFMFLSHRPAQMLALGQALNFAVGLPLYSYFGLARVLGLGHVVGWTPGLVAIAQAVRADDNDGGGAAYTLWLRLALFFGWGSLALDLADSLRFLLLGDVAEACPGDDFGEAADKKHAD